MDTELEIADENETLEKKNPEVERLDLVIGFNSGQELYFYKMPKNKAEKITQEIYSYTAKSYKRWVEFDHKNRHYVLDSVEVTYTYAETSEKYKLVEVEYYDD